MGDRIAIMQKGGRLAQYATPAELLSAPADDFVADFVGADRALKRLSLQRVRDVELGPPNGSATLVVSRDALLRDVLSQLLDAGADHAGVRDADGQLLGSVSLAQITAVLA